MTPPDALRRNARDAAAATALHRGAADPVATGLLASLAAAAPGASTVAVAVHRAGERLVAVGGRTAHHATGRPAEPGTRFALGSVTKTYTALLLAELTACGEVGYDDPIDRFLPPGAAPYRRVGGAPITLLHLATHTSGLPRLPPGLLRSALPRWFSNPYAAYGPGELLAALARTRPSAAPGTRVRYSNFGVGLLGMLLARAAGEPYGGYEQALASRVLGPLGLHRTGVNAGAAGDATGYWHGRARPPWRIPGLAGAGALHAGPDELLRYLEALLDPVRAAGGEGPLATALAEVARPRLVVRPGEDRIALVWNARRRPGHLLLFHSGGTRGCTAFVGFSPERQVALAAVANRAPALDGAFIQRAYLLLRELAGGTTRFGAPSPIG
ncbi:serine hydrolase domain-containing protein [Streptomyces sp. NPDC059853]|uniref:serine hydrolase domain-containing protein n=1 Tax=Streptomyces sp. NPDC059853 TaxID=3346973 RepID=UPI00365999AA